MKRLYPSQIYILGNAGMAFTAGIYLTAFLVFLWEYLAKDFNFGDNVKTITYVLSAKILLETCADIASSFFADLSQRFGRRTIFLTGIACQLIGFIVLVVFMLIFQPGSTEEFARRALWILILAECFRALGDAFISGTFDGWAVSLEVINDPDFQKSPMFAMARVANRLSILIGSTFAIVFLIGQNKLLQSIPPGLPSAQYYVQHSEYAVNINYAREMWTGLWFLTALFHACVFGLLWAVTAGFPNISKDIQKQDALPAEEDRSRFSDWVRAVNTAINRTTLSILLIQVCWDVLASINTYMWPVLAKNAIGEKPVYYFAIVGFIVMGLIAALTARRLADKWQDRSAFDVASFWSLITAAMVLIYAIGILLQARLPEGTGKYIGIITLLILICVRYPQYVAEPFIQTITHENIGSDERIRAAVVSIRTSVVNFSAWVAVTLIIGKGTDPTWTAITLILVALMITGLMVKLRVIWKSNIRHAS